MKELTLEIEGIDFEQKINFVNDLKSLPVISDIKDIKQLSQIEFKEVGFTIVLFIKDVGIQLLIDLLAKKILEFFEREKSNDNKPIEIIHRKITFVQGDTKLVIEEKIKKILNEM